MNRASDLITFALRRVTPKAASVPNFQHNNVFHNGSEHVTLLRFSCLDPGSLQTRQSHNRQNMSSPLS